MVTPLLISLTAVAGARYRLCSAIWPLFASSRFESPAFKGDLPKVDHATLHRHLLPLVAVMKSDCEHQIRT